LNFKKNSHIYGFRSKSNQKQYSRIDDNFENYQSMRNFLPVHQSLYLNAIKMQIKKNVKINESFKECQDRPKINRHNYQENLYLKKNITERLIDFGKRFKENNAKQRREKEEFNCNFDEKTGQPLFKPNTSKRNLLLNKKSNQNTFRNSDISSESKKINLFKSTEKNIKNDYV